MSLYHDLIKQTVMELLKTGERIEAIKHYRYHTMCGLEQAWQYVGDVQREMNQPPKQMEVELTWN